MQACRAGYRMNGRSVSFVFLVDHVVSIETKLMCCTKSPSHGQADYKVTNQGSKLQALSHLWTDQLSSLCCSGMGPMGIMGLRQHCANTALCLQGWASSSGTQTSCLLVNGGIQSNSPNSGNVWTACWGEIMASSTWSTIHVSLVSKGKKKGRKEGNPGVHGCSFMRGDTLQSNVIPTLVIKRPRCTTKGILPM